MDEDQVAHHGNVTIAGGQMQCCALVIVTIIHLHIIATQHEIHLPYHKSAHSLVGACLCTDVGE